MKSYMKQVAAAATDSERKAILLEGANFFSAKMSETIRCNRADIVLMYAVLKRYEDATLQQMRPAEIALADMLKASMGSVTICL